MKRRKPIKSHLQTDLVKWLTCEPRIWERSGFNTMNTKAEREGFFDLLMVGEDVDRILMDFVLTQQSHNDAAFLLGVELNK